MSNVRFDRELESAEAALDRLDDERGQSQQLAELDEAEVMATGMRVDDGEPLDVQDGEDEEHHFDGELIDAIDAFNEAFNARDLDALLEVVADEVEAPGLGGDRANLAGAVEDVWDQRPTAILTRGDLGGQPVAILWDIGDDGRWWRVAPLLFDGGVVDGRLAVVELADDPDAAAEATADGPDEEFDEGTRWEEWESGVAPD